MCKTTLTKGKYRLHAWGASGGHPGNAFMKTTDNNWNCTNHGGAGAYIHGDLTLNADEDVYVYMGEAPYYVSSSSSMDRAYNGGGAGRDSGVAKERGGSGGGATDFCIGSADCATYSTHWPYRILVAGGGGGASAVYYCDTNYEHGTGGSGTWQGDGGNGLRYGKQKTDGGIEYAHGGFGSVPMFNYTESLVESYTSLFGKGMDARQAPGTGAVLRTGGGGGGWYGGFFVDSWKDNGGGAGSSYAFTGANQGLNGKQNSKYALTAVSGENGGPNQIRYEHNARYAFSKRDGIGNIGNGYAIIEVLDE